MNKVRETTISGGFGKFEETETAPTPKPQKRVPFTIRDLPETKELLDHLQYLKQYVVDRKPTSQGDVVREALQLLAKKMKYDKLKEEYAEDLANATITAGRKTGR